MKREKIHINGIVQGVGFRPFVYKKAKENNLSGYVSNNSLGVEIEVEGHDNQIESFHHQLKSEAPAIAKIKEYIVNDIDLNHDSEFVIKESLHESTPTTFISPDIASCDECLIELFDNDDHRYRYPFINCTNCGPRYTIINGIPYDRALTSMGKFTLCVQCDKEYHEPSNRRFHAQPNACPKCGPTLKLHDGKKEMRSADPLTDVIELLKAGEIVAIKGIGGFHLAVDSNNIEAIKLLRERKGRAEKPFALMVKDLDTAKLYCNITNNETALLTDNKRPIVLLQKNDNCPLPENIAPNNQYLGIMLAYSPIHHLLLQDTFQSLIMTSANLSEEPIAIDNEEAIERLSNIADYFLLHDRQILQRCDDSIVRVAVNTTQVIRRSRGYVPYPVFLDKKIKQGILAVGGEQKNTIAYSRENTVFLSQYIGDLDNSKAFSFFENSISHFSKLLEIEPTAVVHDAHPEYVSTKWAKEQELPSIAVQHHHAHMVSVMAENGYFNKTIGIILDGTGYGDDGTIWGGEVLVGDVTKVERFSYLKPVPMPGGSSAIKEPWRMGLSYLYSTYGGNLPDNIPFLQELEAKKISLIIEMIEKKINCHMTSSCGRLFDAVSAILNINNSINYDAQAAIELEMAATNSFNGKISPDSIQSKEIDCTQLISTIVDMLQQGKAIGDIALYFHYQLAEYFISAASAAKKTYNIDVVALSGGVYQNKLFFEYLYKRLQEEKFSILIHKEIPPNDGGLALGQVIIANEILSKKNIEV